jgi:hypothetical protein|eukprot:COSAG02_NODE_3528_length_6612_cov_9.525411_7_plen_53_part_00
MVTLNPRFCAKPAEVTTHVSMQLILTTFAACQDSFYKVVLRAFSWYLLRRHY